MLRRHLAGALGLGVAFALAGCAAPSPQFAPLPRFALSPASGPGCNAQQLLGRAPVAISRRWNLPIVTARINGVPAAMILDTGADSVLVTPDAAASLGLPTDAGRSSVVRGIGGEGSTANVQITSLSLGGVALRNLSVPVGELPIAEADGRRLAGVLGVDLLAAYDIDLDLPRGSLAFYRAGGCAGGPADFRAASAISANRTAGGRLFVPVRVDGTLLLALLDTGFSTTTISTRAARRLGVTPQALAADAPAGFTRGIDLNDVANRWHRFTEIRVGNEVLRDRDVVVADLVGSDAEMLIGMDFLGARRLWLAYAASRVKLEHPVPIAVSALR